MNILLSSINHRLVVILIYLFLLTLAFFSIRSMNTQLLPVVDEPVVAIENVWSGVSPEEMEEELIKPMEKYLVNIDGLKKMESHIYPDYAYMTLRFRDGIDRHTMLMDVYNKLNQVPFRPQQAGQPVVGVFDSQFRASMVELFLVNEGNRLPKTTEEKAEFQRMFTEYVEPALRSIDGVSDMNVVENFDLGRVTVNVSASQLTKYGIKLSDVKSAILAKKDLSIGLTQAESRQLSVRYLGKYDVQQLDEVIVAVKDDVIIYLKDVASIFKSLEPTVVRYYIDGYTAYYVRGLKLESGADLLATTNVIRSAVDELNKGPLKQHGFKLAITSDDSESVIQSIEFLFFNLLVGTVIAISVLYLFTRNIREILTIFTAVPCSIAGSIVLLSSLDISLNIIVLASIALAVGMILDSSIVLVNHIRNQRNATSLDEKVKASKSIVSVLFTSTITTIVVLIPIIFMSSSEGQLFKEFSIALSATIFFSFISSITVVPALLKYQGKHFIESENTLSMNWYRFSKKCLNISSNKIVTVIMLGFIVLPVFLFYYFSPKIDLMPKVNSNTLQVYYTLPGNVHAEEVEKLFLVPIMNDIDEIVSSELELKDYRVITYNNREGELRLSPKDKKAMDELKALLASKLFSRYPNVDFWPQVVPLANISSRDTRSITLQIHGDDLKKLKELGTFAQEKLKGIFPDLSVRNKTPLDFSNETLNIIPNPEVIALSALSTEEVGSLIASLNNGDYVQSIYDEGRDFDVYLTVDRDSIDAGGNESNMFDLLSTHISVGNESRQISELIDFEYTKGPYYMVRVNGVRSIMLDIIVPSDRTVSDTLRDIKTKIVPELEDRLPSGYFVSFGDNINLLKEFISNISVNFIIAGLVMLILLVALLNSLKSAMIVACTLPVSVLGGYVAIVIANIFVFQPLDVLALIGFSVVVGLVVNNVVLLIQELKENLPQGLERAIQLSLTHRLRAIVMTTLTSVFGMLPLALVPGSGAEIYRGLALVILGGVIFNAIFLPLMFPVLSRLFFKNINQEVREEEPAFKGEAHIVK
ncbi:efflux RND transporter permease subunit [Pseudoalteromonas luteoviolacea]|uniref:Acriflavin resistance protein n=1 Tax=Pseudoalteromonas luteoviolacea NCIMB 1942 TaxID=1365253 RepID=A0A162AD20_9GAMM|nr:efflux RND transporter permease subunit [Pseudoalteromonas luteoviolacea]KZN47803.1 hypothetical protein N482_08810 [Pseudoalteromonas luteoviolacea NCIMB 1942]KZW99539.1 hypothetical protein JL49_16485 [Pseudoalteromonas luteoviolacea]